VKLGLALAFCAAQALAQTYPSKPIKVLVGVPPGGPTDSVLRAVSPELSEALGQQIVVENKPGASAVIATDFTAKAAPDGYTLTFIYITHATNATLMKNLPYDSLADLAPISMVGRQSMVLLANPAFPAASVKELIAAAKASPGKIDYGASDSGSAPHLAGEFFKMLAGIDLTPIYYKGTAPAMTDLIAGHIQVMFVSNISALPHVKSGKLKALGVTGATRTAQAPDIPTIAESGLPGFELVSWQGVVAPAGTSRPIVDRLAGEIGKLLADPASHERFAAMALEPLPGSTPDSFANYIKSEVDRWAEIVKNSGAQLE